MFTGRLPPKASLVQHNLFVSVTLDSLLIGKAAACAADELDMLFEGAEQGDAGAERRDGISGARSVLSSFARFMTSLSK